MKEKLKQLELFLKSTDFERGIKVGFGIAVPFTLLYILGYFEYAPAVVLGLFLNVPGDIPGSAKRKVNALLISIGLTMVITAIILFSKPFLPLLLLVLTAISFFVSLISIYGFRASLVSFSGLLAMVLAFAIQKETPQEILLQILLMGIGGLWYLIVTFIFKKITPKKDQNQLLSDTLLLIGQYLKLRGKLLTKKTKRDDLLKETFVLQHQISEKHETLREALLTERKRSGRSRYEEKQLLIFISSINILELIEAKHLDYKMIDAIFGERKEFLKASKKLNKIMGNHLIRLSELLIQKDKIPNKNTLLKALTETNNAITNYIDTIKLPEAREGALVLKNLYDYQEQLVYEIRAIRRVMANVKSASKVSLKKQDSNQFLTLQEYNINILLQNFSLNSSMFRHSLRLTIALVFGYLLGFVLNIQNTYWILLTIIVIMRPSYGLTKERSKDRIIGTLIGAVVAVGIVLITQNMIVYSILAIVSLILAFSLVQQNYKFAAFLITISVIFLYSLANPNAFEVIQYRVIDTIIGATIAVVANYLLFPSWEVNTIKQVLLETLKMNREYLLAMQNLYKEPTKNRLPYNLARKEAFLAISNLNAAFQRLTQDPKSKQKEFQLIYEIVTLNQTMISAIASIGNFIINHKTTPASKDFNNLIKKISTSLQVSLNSLESNEDKNKITEEVMEDAHEKLLDKYTQLSNLRDKNIEQGKTEIDTDTLHGLQEAFLISNHMSWLRTLSENLQKATKKYRSSMINT
ncbi:putative membrane protein YccC [Maribacter vaceletii]|uniref:Putative membrane protein YccC n=1 Tax=Maribacter vaceletii TaxID=1206816 RepID=A0A495EED3_9FLAO|nr:FUSC family membrane protein [Maribacter vaceletii]RKR14247.1 putative membrane protein YccC [Maribacter vaceletii]